MRIVAPGPALTGELRAEPPGTTFEVRDGEGALVTVATMHEAEILVYTGSVEGCFNRRRFKYLRCKCTGRTALARLRRLLASTARTVCEASQLTIKERFGCGVTYAHFTKRTNTYRPSARGDYLRTIVGPYRESDRRPHA